MYPLRSLESHAGHWLCVVKSCESAAYCSEVLQMFQVGSLLAFVSQVHPWSSLCKWNLLEAHKYLHYEARKVKSLQFLSAKLLWVHPYRQPTTRYCDVVRCYTYWIKMWAAQGNLTFLLVEHNVHDTIPNSEDTFLVIDTILSNTWKIKPILLCTMFNIFCGPDENLLPKHREQQGRFWKSRAP